jgi:hypothetical protein
MASPPDDLQAVRTLVDTLTPFEAADQERILRWVREKLQLPASETGSAPSKTQPESPGVSPERDRSDGSRRDIKSFVSEKNPSSDMQFAATVAYYFAFEAPPGERKDSITADDLQDACRQVDRHRLKRPIKTLHNAHASGLLDKAGERGAFKINTVGENLVAVTLPSGSGTAAPRRAKKNPKQKKRKQPWENQRAR